MLTERESEEGGGGEGKSRQRQFFLSLSLSLRGFLSISVRLSKQETGAGICAGESTGVKVLETVGRAGIHTAVITTRCLQVHSGNLNLTFRFYRMNVGHVRPNKSGLHSFLFNLDNQETMLDSSLARVIGNENTSMKPARM